MAIEYRSIRRWARSARLLSLCLALFLPLTGWAQQPAEPQAPATPIPAAEVATRAAEVTDLLANVEALSAPTPQILDIQRELPERSKRLRAAWEATVRRLAARPSAPQLEEMAVAWHGVHREMSTWAEELTAQGNRLQQDTHRLPDLHEAWMQSLREAQSAKTPPQVLQEIQSVLAAISTAQARVNARLASLLILQYQVAGQVRLCDQALAQITQARSDLARHLGTQDASPLWSPALWAGGRGQFSPALAAAVVRWRDGLLNAARSQTRGILLQGLLFGIVLTLLLRARSRTQTWLTPEAGIAAAVRMLDRPASSAMVLSFLATPLLYPGYSLAVFRTAKLAGIVPALRLLTPFVPAAQAGRLYGLGLIMAIDAFRPFIVSAPELDQLLFAAEMLGATLLLGRLVLAERRAQRQGGNTEVGTRPPAFSAILTILWPTFGLAFLAAALGYLQFGRLVGDAALESAYAAMAILIAIWVLEVLFSYALRARPVTLFESVRRYRTLVERRAGQVLRLIGAALWILFSLQPFTLFGSPASIAHAVLQTGIAWGAFRITLGDTLVFVVTVWAAFVISAVTRAVLEADVFPRVRLAKGIPLALANLTRYAILLVGFLIGLGALGVDLTKVTILLGAFGVGVGFGLQTLVSNFSAGLILLFERPIREGDSIQVGDVQGEVRHIGVRASTVRTGRGADVFVPNSQLLSDKITNWTYTDRALRVDLPVSVGPDSEPRRVIELLRRAAGGHPDILPDPAPAALCLGFAGNGLAFELRAWTDHFERSDDIRSELAESVYRVLAEAKIPLK